jgi:hypothetical protein
MSRRCSGLTCKEFCLLGRRKKEVTEKVGIDLRDLGPKMNSSLTEADALAIFNDGNIPRRSFSGKNQVAGFGYCALCPNFVGFG